MREDRIKGKKEQKKNRDNKYQHPRPGSIFLHPVVCVCCIRRPVGIQTLQTSSHLPSWLLSSAALWSQDGTQSLTFRRITFKWDIFQNITRADRKKSQDMGMSFAIYVVRRILVCAFRNQLVKSDVSARAKITSSYHTRYRDRIIYLVIMLDICWGSFTHESKARKENVGDHFLITFPLSR